MQIAEITTANNHVHIATGKQPSWVGAILSFWGYRRHRHDYEHLLELPDYLLEDAGLTRSQLVALARRRPNPEYFSAFPLFFDANPN
jgi:uncharacterized protein YjiS (DUF1127 family)